MLENEVRRELSKVEAVGHVAAVSFGGVR